MSERKKPISANKVLTFVVNELIRFQKALNEHDFSNGFSSFENPNDYICSIPCADFGSYIIGVEANNRLYELADNLIEKNHELAGRTQSSDLVKIMKNRLGSIFSNRTPMTDKVFVAKCIDELKETKEGSHEFYIPCLAPNYDGLKRFSIGPVLFYEKSYFFEKFADRFVPDDLAHLEKFKSHYKVQNWIASIRVENFCSTLAEERAFLSVRIAIASMKAQLDLSASKWLGTRKQTLPDLQHYSLHRKVGANESEEITFGGGWENILNGSSEEVEHLWSYRAYDWFLLVGSFLKKINRDGHWQFLENKLVTAFIWLDIGNSPVSNAERVIAFSNCLETLFVTSDRKIKDQLVQRSSIILQHSGGDENLNGRVKDFYEARCSLVHGENTPLNIELKSAAHLGKYLTDHCIVGMLYFSAWLIVKHQTEGTHQHKRPFNGKNSFTRAFDTEIEQFFKEIIS